MRPFRLFSLLFLLLAACSGWETSYSDVVPPAASRAWGPATIDVLVPRTLTVSEANRFAPDADIVWREDPIGDRYAQVDAIVTAGAKRAASRMSGHDPVTVKIVLQEFHALTERAQFSAPGGVHNISFVAQVFDSRTGEALTEADVIRADLAAYTGEQSVQARARGITQKRRIVSHIDRVLSGWLGLGPDPRGQFSGVGR